MLGLNPSMRFYLCEGPVDMRKGIFHPCRTGTQDYGQRALHRGHFHLFLSKDRGTSKSFIMIQGGIRALLEEAGQRPFPPACFLQGQSSL